MTFGIRVKSAPLTKTIISFFVITCFISTSFIPSVEAQYSIQTQIVLPQPGMILPQSDVFTPVNLKGIHLNPNNSQELEFILDRGQAQLNPSEMQAETKQLIHYFLAALTTPGDQMWVNLSPNEPDRIIADGFGQTLMGRDLLAQDYLLKQLTSSLLYPEEPVGKKFWDLIYAKAFKKYGTMDIPVDTFHKVWIAPGKARVYQHEKGVLILDADLQVMLEKDYFVEKKSTPNAHTTHDFNKDGLSSEVMQDVIIPVIQEEVNRGGMFKKVRQIYHAVILAKWFKEQLIQKAPQTLFGQYADQQKLAGIDHGQEGINQKIYQQYVEAFKAGVMDFIKEEKDPLTGDMIPRHYFSGGVEFNPELETVYGLGRQGDWNRALKTSQRATDRALVSFDPIRHTEFDDDAALIVNDNRIIFDLNDVSGEPIQYLANILKTFFGMEIKALGIPLILTHPDSPDQDLRIEFEPHSRKLRVRSSHSNQVIPIQTTLNTTRLLSIEKQDERIQIQVLRIKNENAPTHNTRIFNVGALKVKEESFVTFVSKLTKSEDVRLLLEKYRLKLTSDQINVLETHLEQREVIERASHNSKIIPMVSSENNNYDVSTQAGFPDDPDRAVIVKTGTLEVVVEALLHRLANYKSEGISTSIQWMPGGSVGFNVPVDPETRIDHIEERVQNFIASNVDGAAQFKLLEIIGRTSNETILVVGQTSTEESLQSTIPFLRRLLSADLVGNDTFDRSQAVVAPQRHGGIDMNIEQIDYQTDQYRLIDSLYFQATPMDAVEFNGIVPVNIQLVPLQGQLPMILGLYKRDVPAIQREYVFAG